MSNNIELGDKHAAATLLGVHPGSLQRYRRSSEWFEGAHYFKLNSRTIRYNMDLLRDWLVNRGNPEIHLLKVQDFLKKSQRS